MSEYPYEKLDKLQIAKLYDFLQEHKIKYFNVMEVCRASLSRQWYAMPPENLWQNIIPTLQYLDKVRELYGALVVCSCYRSPEINAKIKDTARNSQHMKFRAVDFYPLHSDLKSHIWVYLKVDHCTDALREAKSGLGRYTSFFHIDFGYKWRKWRW